MNKLQLKEKLLAEGKRLQETVVHDLETSTTNLLTSANREGEEDGDSRFESTQEERMDERDLLQGPLDAAVRNLTILQSISPDAPHGTVTLGSVVMTPDQNFFVSINLGTMVVEQQSFVGISTAAPIYQAMANKKEGDSFVFQDREYRIESLF